VKQLPVALGALAAYKQFVIYKKVPSESRPGKTDKFPIDSATGIRHNAHDPSIWIDSQTAITVAANWKEPYGVGFVLTENDPFWCVDIDNCLTPAGWAPHAVQVCQLLSGCAMEISQSGTGIHLFGSGKPPLHGCKNESLNMEFYHSGRFIALTGINATGQAERDFSPVLPSLVATYFPADPNAGVWGDWRQEWTVRCAEGTDAAWSGPEDDTDLIRRAMASRSSAQAFGNKASFADLWFADEQVLSRCYPDPARGYDASSADAALAQHLAFWTGKNADRMLRLMWESKLVREKWEREDYLPRTICGAVARQVDVLKTAVSVTLPVDADLVPEASDIEGMRILDTVQQRNLFRGCVYITDGNRALTPGGHIFKPEQFRVHYGGYTFIMDNGNTRQTRDAWEAFTQSQLLDHPKANGACFKPALPAGQLVTRDGLILVNTYVPVNIPRMVGDITPYLNHMAKVLPNERDALILQSYMAACVQHKGIKFQWAPLLQGVEGNGKTFFARCVAEAIGRRYVHWPNAAKLAEKFNSWMVGKLFFAVEDIYVPDARREVIEQLKPMITGGDGLEIEAKGIDQTSGDICGNFFFNSNHKGAVPKTRNDRRFAVLFSAQQQSEDLSRDGMAGEYFPALYKWAREGGYAIVAEYLHTFPIPAEFNPAGDCQRAPDTSTTSEAIHASSGMIEQEIEECIAQGLPGFSGGWISSMYLERLLERIGFQRKITHARRKEILESLGYHWHPALRDGRVNNTVYPDGGKPRLYIHESNMAMQITAIKEVEKAYETANASRPGALKNHHR
jgi:hypothetical protein